MAIKLNNNISQIKVGDYVWCKYIATSNSVGTFSDFAIKNDDEVSSSVIPPTSSNAPNGYFKFICVDEYNKKKILIADRNIQHNITWDTLNSAGIASGSGLPVNLNMSSNYNTVIKLLTGGINGSDKDNEWDKYIVGSTLNGSIVAGDNNVWNWSNKVFSFGSTTFSTTSYKILRGISSVSTYTYAQVDQISTSFGFRPVLIIEDTIKPHTFIKSNNTYKSFKNNQWNTISTTLPSQPTFISDGMKNLAVLDRKESKFTQDMVDNGALGEGKVFKNTVDLKRLFEITKIEVE